MASTGKKTKKGRAPADHLKPTSAKAWARTHAAAEFDLPLPSGNVARVRRPGPIAILQSGIMPDTLMPIINEAIKRGQGAKIEDAIDLSENPEMLTEILEGMDKALLEIVVEPSVAYHKRPTESGDWETIPEEERDLENFVYTDEVDMDDKMFLFNFAVGGTRDLESFREEHAGRMGDVADDAIAGDASE